MKSSRSITWRQESTNPETTLGNFLQNREAQPAREAGSICSVLLLLQECRSSDYFWYETYMHSTAMKTLRALSVHNAWEEELYSKRREILLAPCEPGQEQITMLQLKNGRVTQAECRREKPPSAQSNSQRLQPQNSVRWKESPLCGLHSFSPGFVPPPRISVPNLRGNSCSAVRPVRAQSMQTV